MAGLFDARRTFYISLYDNFQGLWLAAENFLVSGRPCTFFWVTVDEFWCQLDTLIALH